MTIAKQSFRKRALTLATTLAVASLAAPIAAQADASGSMGLVSKYVFRGLTTDASGSAESDVTAVQAGLKYSHGSGAYAGWWGSSLDYVNPTAATTTTKGVENDLYVGYSKAFGKLTLDVGAVYYVYVDVADADVLEPYVNLTFGPVTFGAAYLTKDVVWGNEGDTYTSLTYTHKLPSDFTFTGKAGYYFYGDGALANAIDSGFRHLDLTLTHPLGKTGFDMSVAFIVGGEDRAEIHQRNTMVLGLSSSF